MALKDDVIRILRGPVTQRIRFIFAAPGGNVTIAPQTFEVVARAIDAGKVHVARPTDLAAGVAAQYNDVARTRADGTQVAADTIEVNSATGRINEGSVLHECLHCAYDLLKTGITAADEEASAYIVSSMYFRMTSVRHPRWNAEPHASGGRAADTLLAQYARGTAGIPRVGDLEWRVLRVAVMIHPTYLFPFSAQGNFALGPAISGGSYPHDG